MTGKEGAETVQKREELIWIGLPATIESGTKDVENVSTELLGFNAGSKFIIIGQLLDLRGCKKKQKTNTNIFNLQNFNLLTIE